MRLIICLLLFSSFSFSTTSQNEIQKKFEKKINKMIKKAYGKSDISLEETFLPDAPEGIPNRALFSLNLDGKKAGILVINNARGCKINGCKSNSGGSDAKYENFWYGVIFDNDLKIKAVRVLEYSSDYGYEICSKNWLKQFQGFTGCDLKYGGKEVDSISGATVSGESIVSDISNLCWLLQGEQLVSRNKN